MEIAVNPPKPTVPAKGSLYATLGWILDLIRSEARRHAGWPLQSIGRINPDAKDSDGDAAVDFEDVSTVPLKGLPGASFVHMEEEGNAVIDLETGEIQHLTWRTASRLQKSTWDTRIEREIEKEMARLGPLLREYDFISVAFGCDWTMASGESQRAWLKDTIERIRRYNASAIAKACGVYIVLRAAHIAVQSGQGLIRPMHPHWHLVLSVRHAHGGKDGWERLEDAVVKLEKLVGAEVTYKGRTVDKQRSDHSDLDGPSFVSDSESLRRMLAYLLRYPVQLVHPTERDEDGLRRKIDLDDPLEGLRLVEFPPQKAQWKSIAGGIPPSTVDSVPWDGLTDPLVMLEPFKALAGLVLLQPYSIPGAPKERLGWRAVAKQKRKTERLKRRAAMKKLCSALSPWARFRLIDFWLRLLMALPETTDDPHAKNVLIRVHRRTNRKTGKVKRLAYGKHVTTLEELREANPKLAEEWDKEKNQGDTVAP